MKLTSIVRNLVIDFFTQKLPRQSSTPLSAMASCLPTFQSQWNPDCTRVRTSAETRVLGVNLILLPSYFPRRKRLTAGKGGAKDSPGGQRCPLVHLLLSMQVMSVIGKERPCITPCSSKEAPHTVRSNGSILTSIVTRTSLP